MEELHIGDKVKITGHTGIKSYDNLIWEVMSEPWNLFGREVVYLAGYPGHRPFPVQYLRKVNE